MKKLTLLRARWSFTQPASIEQTSTVRIPETKRVYLGRPRWSGVPSVVLSPVPAELEIG